MEKNENINERESAKVLSELYNAQIASFFPDDAMPKVMEKMGLSEEEAINHVSYFLSRGLVKKPAHKPSFFLRPGYIQCFPVTLTARGLSLVKAAGDGTANESL